MGFWQDASPAVKGAIVVGGLLIAYLLAAMMLGLWPYGVEANIQRERGFDPQTAEPAEPAEPPGEH